MHDVVARSAWRQKLKGATLGRDDDRVLEWRRQARSYRDGTGIVLVSLTRKRGGRVQRVLVDMKREAHMYELK